MRLSLLHVLLIDDSPVDAELLLVHLRREGFETVWERVETAADLRAALATREWDLVLCDYVLPLFSAPAALRLLAALAPDLPAIIVSRQVGEEYAVEVMRAGARDYIRKDNLARLVPAIERELAESEDRRARKRAEAQVQVLARAVEQSPASIVITDPAGNIEYVNRRFLDVSEYTLEEAIGQNPRILKSGETSEEEYRRLWEAITAGREWRGEFHNKKKTGELFWELVSISPIRDAAGAIVHFVGIKEDVAERKRVEGALRQREADLNEAQRLAQIGSWKWDPTTDTITWSPELYRLTGWDPTRPPPPYLEHAQLFTNDSWARMQVAVQSCLQTGAPYELDLELVRHDGATRRVLLRGEAEHDAEGRIVHLRGTVQDTTERTRAAQALRDSEERFRTIFDAVNDAILVNDPVTGRLLEANQRAAELSGYTREELLALDIGALSSGISPYDQQGAMEFIRAAVQGVPQLVEWRARDKAGRVFWVEVNLREATIGGERRLLMTARDISERKHGEEALRAMFEAREQERKQFAAILDHLVQGVMVIAADGTPVWANRACVSLHGYRREEDFLSDLRHIATHFVASYLDGRPILLNEGPVARALRGETVTGLEIRVQRRVGLKEWIGAYDAVPIRNEEGTVTQVVVTINDITARKQVEASLRESAATFTSLFHNSPVGMTLNSIDDGTYRDVNSVFLRDSGFIREEVIGRTSQELGIFADPLHRKQLVEEVKQVGAAYGKPCVFRTKAGDLRHMLICTSIIASGSLEYLLSSILDVTEREQAVAALRDLSQTLERRVAERTVELAAANAAMETFAYSISHDLRAPLRHIQGFVRVLEEELGPQAPTEQRQYLAHVNDASARMNLMITALLRLSSLGRAPLELRPLSLADLAMATFAELQATTPGRKVNFVVQPLPEVRGDPTLLRELLDNLLGNALKFTRTVAAARIEVGVERRDGQYAFYVRDNGVGFDPQRAAKLFGVFQRLHSEAEFEGTGVGLSIVKRIVEIHGGRVWAEAVPGAGATFWFTLPAPPDVAEAG